MLRPALPLSLLAILASAACAAAAPEPDLDAQELYKTKIRALLSDQCVKCHGDKKQKGGLRLDSLRAAMQGGDGGAAITPGEPEASLLIKAISYEDADLQMPPDGKLEPAQLADLEKWIKLGAPWPDSEKDAATK